LQAAQDQRAYTRAVGSKDRGLSLAYLDFFPNGRFIEDVRQHLAALAPRPPTVTPLPPISVPSPPVVAPPPPVPTLPAANGTPDEIYGRAFDRLKEGDYQRAERELRAFIQRFPQHPLAGNAQYWLGETYFARYDYQNAMVAFAEGYRLYKTNPKGPDNLLKLGITLAKLNRKNEACTSLARFDQEYPKATEIQKRRVGQERQALGCP
jgi:tol-pal system protein YbgF